MSKVLAVGDIHTKMWIIEAVTKLVNQYDSIVFVGDYADDWVSEPCQTIETWRRLKMLTSLYPDKVKAVVGNHDFAYTMEKIRPQSSGYNQVTQLMLNAPENRDLKTWVKNLPVQLDIDGVTYTHAGRDVNWNTSTDEHFLWGNDSPIWNRPDGTVYGPEAQVFGHTPQLTCTEIEDNIWCIDTFSTYHDGTPIGDQTVLEITGGKEFKKKKLDKNDNNNSATSVETEIS